VPSSQIIVSDIINETAKQREYTELSRVIFTHCYYFGLINISTFKKY